MIESADAIGELVKVESEDEESQGAIVKQVYSGGRNRCSAVSIRSISQKWTKQLENAPLF